MVFWFLLLLTVFLVCVGSAVYIVRGISRFGFLKRRISNGKRRAAAAFALLAVVVLILCLTMGLLNTAVCIIHLTLFWLISDGIGKLLRRRVKARAYIAGYIAFAVTVVYLSWGAYNAYHVDVTRYSFTTSKTDESLRIALIADSHMGTTFDAEGFEKQLGRIAEYSPDVLLITGDFVDDETSLEDMQKACAALGRFEAKYGVYFSFGNHDKGYYGDAHRGYGYTELVSELEKNGVTVLEDETVTLGNGYVICGRQDYSTRSRADITGLISGYSDSYTIIMDHQPHDYKNEAAAGADLVLSGHTHGGQLIPINYVGVLTGENDSRYGYKHIENTDFIVTSGISDWELIFKTGCKSEFVIIDINGGE